MSANTRGRLVKSPSREATDTVEKLKNRVGDLKLTLFSLQRFIRVSGST